MIPTMLNARLPRMFAALTALLLGLISGPALAQAVAALADVTAGGAPSGTWESLGMGGAALAWAAWSVREVNLARQADAERRTAEAKGDAERYAADLRALGEQLLQESRDYAESIQRIYGSKGEVHQQMIQLYERELEFTRQLLLAQMRGEKAPGGVA